MCVHATWLSDQSSHTRVQDLPVDHLINKACYAKLWGYDFIFNMTFIFDKKIDEELGEVYWLKYGVHGIVYRTCVIESMTIIWILYADTDYVCNDMKTPIETFFFKNW